MIKNKITRFELISSLNGREVIIYSNDLSFELQDHNRTLKVYYKGDKLTKQSFIKRFKNGLRICNFCKNKTNLFFDLNFTLDTCICSIKEYCDCEEIIICADCFKKGGD